MWQESQSAWGGGFASLVDVAVAGGRSMKAYVNFITAAQQQHMMTIDENILLFFVCKRSCSAGGCVDDSILHVHVYQPNRALCANSIIIPATAAMKAIMFLCYKVFSPLFPSLPLLSPPRICHSQQLNINISPLSTHVILAAAQNGAATPPVY